MRKFLLTLACASVMSLQAAADEGMWILSLLSRSNIDVMQKEGCHLTPEQIYSVNHGSIKDAIVIFGGGCTGEIVSDNGLVFTNHHCGYSSIQQLSSVEHNYLRDGFWAKSFAEDLPVEGLEVRFLNSFEDVTSRVMEGVTSDLAPEARINLIRSHCRDIEQEAAKDSTLESSVTSFFENNQFFLIKYKVYTDIRLVGTPPESIGKFGHDTDNWQWPRHTGDISIFRVYAGADNEPAAYSPDNKPYRPAYHLPVSLKGMKPGDFSMTIGFPGTTNRYESSWGVKQMRDVENASRIEPRDIKQKIWLEDMLADQSVYIKYASKFARSSNYNKNSIGMNRGIDNLNVIGRKEAEQDAFKAWAKANGTKEQKGILKQLRKLAKENEPYVKATSYMMECLFAGPEIFRFARKLGYKTETGDTEAITALVRDFYKDYSVNTDRKVTAALMSYYATHIDSKFHPKFFKEIPNEAAFTRFTDDLFASSILADSSRLIKAIADKDYDAIKNDKATQCANDIVDMYLKQIVDKSTEIADKYEDAKRIYLAARMQMQPERDFYSDANFTMRLSYGQIGGYSTADTTYTYFTDIDGLMAKEDPNNWEFVVAPKLKEIYNNKDFGPYADKDGKMHICFISNNDITGGNSGSPVINGDGELIGLAFDGNWEAMSGDIIFEPALQRCICVDIRYVLLIIDKIGGAQNLIDELTINK